MGGAEGDFREEHEEIQSLFQRYVYEFGGTTRVSSRSDQPWQGIIPTLKPYYRACASSCSALSQWRSARRAGHHRATPPNAASVGKEPASKGIGGVDRGAHCPDELGRGGVGRAQSDRLATSNQEAARGRRRSAVEREAHSISAPALGLHDGPIVARRHGELRNRGHTQAELARDELAPRLELDAICL
jgi:hypothetical protein